MVWNLSATGKQHGYTDKDVAKIRELAATLPDHVVGERLGFHPRKVCAIRNAYSIPPATRSSGRTRRLSRFASCMWFRDSRPTSWPRSSVALRQRCAV